MKENNKVSKRTISYLLLMSIICFLLSIFRSFYTHSSMYLFLNWNLFLAFIPYGITMFLKEKENHSYFRLISMLFIWLMFFPNSPYILTDLFHLQKQSLMPIWFDLVLVLSFAWTGLFAGILSLFDFEKLIKKYFMNINSTLIVVAVLFLAAFGIYLGRFLRFNSWDILQQPQHLILDIADRFIHPFQHLRTWSVTILLGLILNMVYFSFQLVIMPQKK